MAFMERMGDTLLNMGKDVSQKAKDMSGIAKLKFNIRSKEDFVRAQYIELGKAYYERHKGEEDNPEQARFIQIEEALEDIAQMERQILELKGAKKCPDCGAEMAETAEYCSVCGAKLCAAAEEEKEIEFGPEFEEKEEQDSEF